jgi:hypothetical protein
MWARHCCINLYYLDPDLNIACPLSVVFSSLCLLSCVHSILCCACVEPSFSYSSSPIHLRHCTHFHHPPHVMALLSPRHPSLVLNLCHCPARYRESPPSLFTPCRLMANASPTSLDPPPPLLILSLRLRMFQLKPVLSNPAALQLRRLPQASRFHCSSPARTFEFCISFCVVELREFSISIELVLSKFRICSRHQGKLGPNTSARRGTLRFELLYRQISRTEGQLGIHKNGIKKHLSLRSFPWLFCQVNKSGMGTVIVIFQRTNQTRSKYIFPFGG